MSKKDVAEVCYITDIKIPNHFHLSKESGMHQDYAMGIIKFKKDHKLPNYPPAKPFLFEKE